MGWAAPGKKIGAFARKVHFHLKSGSVLRHCYCVATRCRTFARMNYGLLLQGCTNTRTAISVRADVRPYATDFKV